MIKLFNTTLFFLVFSYIGYGQQEFSTNLIEVDRNSQNPIDWITYCDNEEMVIDYKFVQCDPSIGYDNESILLKFKNKTTQTIQISWNKNLYYDGVCKTCDYPDEYYYEIQLQPFEEVEGNCSISSNNRLKIFSKFVDLNYTKGLKLTAFELVKLNLIVN